MGIALYTLPYSMPFLAAPMRETIDVTPELAKRMAQSVMQGTFDSAHTDVFSSIQERFNEVVDTAPSWSRVQGGSVFRGLPTPLLPSPLAESPEESDCSREPEKWDLECVLRAVEEEAFSPVLDLDQELAATLLGDLVHDVVHSLSVFDADVSPDDDVIVFQALELLGKAAGSEANGIFQEALALPDASSLSIFKALVGIQYIQAFEAVPAVLEVLRRQAPPEDVTSSDPVRIAALNALGAVGDLGVLEMLSKLILGTNLSERGAGIEAAGNIALRVLEHRRKAKSKDTAEIGGHAAIADALISWLLIELESVAFDAREHPALRGEALIALGKVGDERHFDRMMQLMARFVRQDAFEDIDERYDADDLKSLLKGVISGLGWLRDTRAFEIIAMIARNKVEQNDIRLEAFETLYMFGSKRSVSVFKEIAQDESDVLRDEAVLRLRDFELELDDGDDFDLG